MSESTIRVYDRGLTWQCLSGFHAALFGEEAPNWMALENDSRAQRVKSNARRSVFRVHYRQNEYYVKVFHERTLRDKIRSWLRPPSSRQEFENLLFARRSKVPVALPLAWSARRGPWRREECLILQSLGGLVSWEELLWAEPKLDREALAAAASKIGQAVARMHCAGICHADLHPGNLVVGKGDSGLGDSEAYVLDLQGAQVVRRSGHASADPFSAERLKNIATLVAGMQATRAWNLRGELVEAYLRAIQPHRAWGTEQIEAYWRVLRPLVHAHDRAVIVRCDRRCLRKSRYSNKISLVFSWGGWVRLLSRHPFGGSWASRVALPRGDWPAVLNDLVRHRTEGSVLKQGRRNTVTETKLAFSNVGIEAVAKWTQPKSWFHDLWSLVKGSRARQQWLAAHRLIHRRIPTAWPLAAVECRWAGIVPQDSVFITEKLVGTVNLKYLLLHRKERERLSLAQRRQLANAIGGLLAQLEKTDLIHRDCKASNILIRPEGPAGVWKPYLVDLDGLGRRYIPKAVGLQQHIAIIRLAASSLELPDATIKDRLRVLRAYRRELGLADNRTDRRLLWDQLHVRSYAVARASARREQKRQRQRLPLAQREFRNILIIKPSALGDVVRCFPVLSVLRRKYPHAKISWLVRPDCAGLLQTAVGLDRIIEFDRYHYGKMLYRWGAARDFIRFVRELYHQDFDLVLDLQGLIRSGFLGWATGSANRVGFSGTREFAWLFYNERIAAPDPDEHAVRSYWRFAQALGADDQPAAFEFNIDPEAQADAQNLLRVHCPENPTPTILALLVGATHAAKRWPAARFAELATQLHQRAGLVPVLLGAGKVEAELGRQVEQQAEVKVVNLIGKTSLPQLTAVLHRATVVVGNDSGPLHIAAAVGTRTIGLYGPTSPAVVGPYGCRSSVVDAGAAVPREGRYSKAAEHHIDRIAVSEVVDRVLALLNQGGSKL